MSSPTPYRDINLLVSPSSYAFKSASSTNAPALIIDRPSGDLRLDHTSVQDARRITSISGILGILKLKLGKYIIVITKALPVGRLRGHLIYQVVSTDFFPLHDTSLHDPDEDRYLSTVKELIATSPMYFSYSLDMTNSFQRQSQSDYSLPLWQRSDERFFWNRFIQSEIIDFRNGVVEGVARGHRENPDVDPFILPVILGLIDITQTKIKSTLFTFALITRRSRHRAGTRYFSRGINDEGNVSNYNETEQVVILNDAAGMTGFSGEYNQPPREKYSGKELQVLSFVQIRGSVPVYWSEPNNLKYTPPVQLRSVDASLEACRKHFRQQIDTYGEVYCVNLVAQGGKEQKIKNAYEQVVRALIASPVEETQADNLSSEKLHKVEPRSGDKKLDETNGIHYIYFDFHNETKGLQWDRANLLVNEIEEGLIRGQYFHGVEHPSEPAGALDIRTLQTAVVRTNCMDCLDRTNVIQGLLGRWTLNRQLADLGVLRAGDNLASDKAFIHLFRNVWADNADAVSKMYSGTGALKTDFTRTGERTKVGAIQDGVNSVVRYIKNNFRDGPRQDALDVYHGVYMPSRTFVNASQLADRRPLIIQAVPYIFAASLFLIVMSLFSSRTWPLLLFRLFWLVVGTWSFMFVKSHGMLYVNWPKLNPPSIAVEGFYDDLRKTQHDPVIGSTIPIRRQIRGYSNAKLGLMEEGKKRTE